MKKFKKQFNKILNQLNLAEKAKEGKLTQEDWDNIAQAYQEKYGSDFYEDQEAAEQESRRGAIQAAAMTMLNDDDPPSGGASADTDPEETAEMRQLRIEKEAEEKARKKAEKKALKLQGQLDALQTDPENDDPQTITMKPGKLGGKTSKTHLFGIEHTMFSLDNRWNKVAANPAYASLNEPDEGSDGASFRKAVRSYASSLVSRYQSLQKSGQLAAILSAELDVDYSELTNSGLGEQFLIARQDALIARILKVPTVYDIFPRRYGVQDRELITNAFFGEFSQAYQEGEIWKGDVDLQPELGHVDDAMYKTLFKSLKWIERQYIGYLNKEGSDPVKWSMIEWMVLNIATVLVQEQSKRRILGFYIKPTAGTPGHMMFASSGVIHTLIRYYHELKLLPLSDGSYNTYSDTSTTFIDAVNLFLSEALEKRGNLDGMVLHLNANHKMWFKASVRRKYGKDFDFKGPDANKVPDWDVTIAWVPNMEQVKLMFLQKPGNIQCLEFLPGEMFKIQFDKDMESVKSWSVWKEGVSAAFSGKQFDTLANLIANDYKLQEIFMNKPATLLADDALTCDGSANFWFQTIENSNGGNITDITNAVDGKVYIIECGHVTNPQTVNAAGKFDQLASNFVPVAVGDYIMVHYNPTVGKFYELERCVNGVRTIVKTKQPNIPGAR